MTSIIKRFQDLTTWKVAHQLVLSIYKLTSSFSAHERFGLASQMNRAAVSIASNVAEGFGRRTGKEKIVFYTVARGSLHELENQVILAFDLSYVDEVVFQQICSSITDVHRLLNALIHKTKEFQVPTVSI